MGYRICYLASKAPPEELIGSLNLTPGPRVEEPPDGDWWAARLKRSGWTILWAEDERFGQRASGQVAELSKKFPTYVCDVNETTMWSSSEFWDKGRQVWKVTHKGDGDDVFDLTETGELPDSYDELKERCKLRQQTDGDGVDHIFDVPLDLAASEIGFRHDEFVEQEDFDAIVTIVPGPKKGLLSRLFGR